MSIGIVALILLSAYVGNSTMEENNKTGYFILVSILCILFVIFGIILS